MRVGELLWLAAAAYPGGLERFEKYWNFSRGRAREGSGDLLVAFVVTELAETHTSEATSKQLLLAAARRMDDAAKQLSAVADHLRSQVPRAAGARVLRPDFSRREPEDS